MAFMTAGQGLTLAGEGIARGAEKRKKIKQLRAETMGFIKGVLPSLIDVGAINSNFDPDELEGLSAEQLTDVKSSITGVIAGQEIRNRGLDAALREQDIDEQERRMKLLGQPISESVDTLRDLNNPSITWTRNRATGKVTSHNTGSSKGFTIGTDENGNQYVIQGDSDYTSAALGQTTTSAQTSMQKEQTALTDALKEGIGAKFAIGSDIIGPTGKVQKAVDFFVGLLPGKHTDIELRAAKRAQLGTFVQRVRAALVADGRIAEWERDELNNIMVTSEEWWENPSTAKGKHAALLNFILRSMDTRMQELVPGTASFLGDKTRLRHLIRSRAIDKDTYNHIVEHFYQETPYKTSIEYYKNLNTPEQ